MVPYSAAILLNHLETFIFGSILRPRFIILPQVSRGIFRVFPSTLIYPQRILQVQIRGHISGIFSGFLFFR